MTPADEPTIQRLMEDLRPYEPLPPLEEAILLRRLCEALGSQMAAAEKLSRSQGWVSQRLALLSLTDALQVEVSSGELPVKVARSLGRLPADQQGPAWEKIRREEKGEAVRLAAGLEPSAAAARLVAFYGAEYAEEIAAEIFAATRR